MADVKLDIIDPSTGLTISTFSLTICTPQAYELSVGNYLFRATYLATGEVKDSFVTIVEGSNTPLDITFTPAVQPPSEYTLTINSTPIQGIPFTINKVI